MLDDAACLPVSGGVLPVSWFRYLPDAHIVDPFHMALAAKDETDLTNNVHDPLNRLRRLTFEQIMIFSNLSERYRSPSSYTLFVIGKRSELGSETL